MRRRDLFSSAILLVIAATYYVASTAIPSSTLEDEVGSRGLPTVLAVLLAVIALGIGARAVLVSPAAAGQAGTVREGEATWPRALGMLALVSLYLPLATVLGYFLALFLIISSVALYERMKPSWRLFAVAAGGAGFFWLLFVYFLGVRQPPGLLF